MVDGYQLGTAKTIEESLYNYETVSGGQGLEYRILFERAGYTPHNVSHIEAPTGATDNNGESRWNEGDELLVMFDPWSLQGAFVYHLRDREIVWEVEVSGSAVTGNPHQGGMLDRDIDGFGSAGDIYCTDKDNNIVVFDKDDESITFQQQPAGYSPNWVHCCHLAVDDNMIISDYGAGRLSKVNLSDMSEMWNNTTMSTPSKIKPIDGAGQGHDPSNGGDYLVADNSGTLTSDGIQEISDSDGTMAWGMNTTAGVPGTSTQKPHSAIRLGRVEYNGNLTVFGSEAGGGLTAIDYEGVPVWGFGNQLRDTGSNYQFSTNQWGLGEITDVFQTLRGRLGFTGWYGQNSAVVGEILSLPDTQQVSYRHADDYFLGGDDYLAPIRTDAWDALGFVFENQGANELNYEFYAHGAPYFRDQSAGTVSESPSEDPLASGTIASGSNVYESIDLRTTPTQWVVPFVTPTSGDLLFDLRVIKRSS